jgi:hypothetical protein
MRHLLLALGQAARDGFAHIAELDEIFEASRGHLEEGGVFFHVVPNSEFYFNAGNLSHLGHQHVNYFSAENGIRLLNSQGFVRASSGTSRAGNELFLWGFFESDANLNWPGNDPSILLKETAILRDYAQKLETPMNEILSKIRKMHTAGESIGFYAGGYEYSVLLDDIKGIRYFDGDPYKHGKVWLRGLASIEPPTNLVTKPVDNLIIFSSHYFTPISSYLREQICPPKSMKIHNLDNLADNTLATPAE